MQPILKLALRSFLIVSFLILTLVTVEATCFLLNKFDIKWTIDNTDISQHTLKELLSSHQLQYSLYVNPIPSSKLSKQAEFVIHDNTKVDYTQRNPEKFINSSTNSVYTPNAGTHRSIITEKKNGRLIYNTQYTIDSHQRRFTPQSNGIKQKHLITLGCSFTFGEGVKDTETIAAQLALTFKKYSIYNNGFGGYGPVHILNRLQEQGALPDVSPKEGIALYFLIGVHLERALYSMSETANNPFFPYYKESPSGQLKHLGSFSEIAPWRYTIYNWIWGSQTQIFFRLNWPPYFQAHHYKRFTKYLIEIRKEYQNQTGHNNFVVVILPRSIQLERVQKLIPFLEKAKIPYFNYSTMQIDKQTNQALTFKYDGHPTAEYYKLVAQQLTMDLPNVGQENINNTLDH